MGELNIEKVPDDKFVRPEDGYATGYYGYTPDDDDADTHTVAEQGPLAEEFYKKSDSAAKPKPAPQKAATAKETAK